MAITNGTNITALEKPEVGVDAGPAWATAVNNTIDAVDAHDHTTNKGSRINTAGILINADLEFNEYQATELKGVVLSTSNASSNNSAIYQSGGNLYWRNATGTAVQVTAGSVVNAGAGSITGMSGTDAGVQFGGVSKTYSFFHDLGNEEFGKLAHSDLILYKFGADDTSADTDYVTIVCTAAASGSSGTITVPAETGTLVTSASALPDIAVTSTTTLKPILTLATNTNDATSAQLQLKNLRGGSNAGVANDDAGRITFWANDAANNNQQFAEILAEAADVTSGGEDGTLSLLVAEYDGTNTAGLVLTGGGADGEVDVTIGAGVAAVTTIAGTLSLGERDIDNVGDIALDSISADGSSITINNNTSFGDNNITHVGDLDCDSVSVDDAAVGLDIIFGGNTTLNKLSLTDNLADALNITQASNSYLQFVTANSAEKIVVGQALETTTSKKIAQKGAFLQSSTHQALFLGL